MSTPYAGLDLPTLEKIKANLVKMLSGGRLASSSVPGLSWTRRIESLADVRTELMYVNQEIANLSSSTKRITRTFMKAV